MFQFDEKPFPVLAEKLSCSQSVLHEAPNKTAVHIAFFIQRPSLSIYKEYHRYKENFQKLFPGHSH